MKQTLLILALAVFFAGCNVTVNEPRSTANNAASNNTTAAANTASADHNSTSADKTTAATPNAEPAASHNDDTKVAAGPDEHKVVNVHFATGKSEGTYSGSFAGYGYVDYKFSAMGGQELTTEIVRSDGNDAILGVMRNDEMVAPGSVQVQDWKGPLPADGSYTIRVGQMRNTARRSNKPVNYSLKIKIVD